jgi:hypothetical protein
MWAHVQSLEFMASEVGTTVATLELDAAYTPHMKGMIMDWNDLEQAAPSIDAILKDRGGFLFEEQMATFRPEIGEDIDEWSDSDWNDDDMQDE